MGALTIAHLESGQESNVHTEFWQTRATSVTKIVSYQLFMKEERNTFPLFQSFSLSRLLL